jgi:NAD-binding of NADP-dependent 3-hydroxyisobutyrate dehydrogenase
MFEDRGARMMAAQFDQVRSAIDIFVKDIGLVSEAAAQSGASIPLTTTARRLYELGHELGMATSTIPRSSRSCAGTVSVAVCESSAATRGPPRHSCPTHKAVM